MASSTVRLPGVPPQVQDLLLWRDWKKSAGVLGSVTVAWFFLGSTLSPWTLMQALSLLVVIAVPVFWTWNFAAPLLKREGPPVPAILSDGISKQHVDNAVGPTLRIIDPILGIMGKLMSGKDLKLSGIVTIAAFIAFKIFGYVSLATLIFLVTLVAFTLPKVYELKKQDVDKVVGIISSKARELYNEVDKVVFKKIAKPQHPAAAVGGVKPPAAAAGGVKTE